MSYYIENNIIKTEDTEFNYEEYGGLGNLVFNSMKRYAENIAQIDPVSGRTDTYESILRNAIRTALRMRNKGIKKGDVVLGSSDNHLDACVPIVAALFLGAIPCSMDPTVTVIEMTHNISQIKPKIIFTVPSAAEQTQEVIKALKLDTEIVVFGESDKYPEFRSFTEQQLGEDEFKPVVCKDVKETAIIFFTSGTTSLAKPCCFDHVHFMRGLIPMNTPDDFLDVERRNYEVARYTSGGSFLCYSSLYWITGGSVFLQNIFIGGTRLLCKKFDPELFWQLIEKYRVLVALMAPFQILELIGYGRPPNVNVDTLVKILTAGTPLRKKHWQLLQDMLPDTDITQIYGMTEVGTITSFQSFNKVHRDYYKKHPECVGFPIRGIWYKVVDTETDEILGPNQEGELLIKSNYIMNGFYNEPTETTFDSDGWLRTGDLVYYTEDCAFYVMDRLKGHMKYRRFPVYPYVVEHEVQKHPAVAHVTVIGIPHEEDGDRPAAFVVLNENYEHVSAEEIREFADERLQDKAKLRGGVWIMKSLPMTSTGKVKRIALRKMVLEGMK